MQWKSWVLTGLKSTVKVRNKGRFACFQGSTSSPRALWQSICATLATQSTENLLLALGGTVLFGVLEDFGK